MTSILDDFNTALHDMFSTNIDEYSKYADILKERNKVNRGEFRKTQQIRLKYPLLKEPLYMNTVENKYLIKVSDNLYYGGEDNDAVILEITYNKATVFDSREEATEIVKQMGTGSVINVLDLIKEPLTVSVPSAVSQYIQEEKQFGFTLYGAYTFIAKCSLLARDAMLTNDMELLANEVHEWVIDGHQEDFAMAWISGYKVEEDSKDERR